MRRKWWYGPAAGVLVMGAMLLLLGDRQKELQEANAGVISGLHVLIDPGHGGFDPGKVGDGKVYEKDVNLQIALYLKQFLESQDVSTEMTRDTDTALGTTKKEDMKNRLEKMNGENYDICVMIHQNSFRDPSVYGMQFFYTKGCQEGLEAAKQILSCAANKLEMQKIRPIKGEDSYYLLKHATVPTVLVECGFLTNPEELSKLCDEYYQKRLAWSLCMGILQWQSAQQKEGKGKGTLLF